MNSTEPPSIDIETGEVVYPSRYNAETGEYEGEPLPSQRTKFRIPPAKDGVHFKKHYRSEKLTRREVELITAAMFLLPTMVLFYPIIGIIVLGFEIILHNWAHRKNKTLKDDTFYYKSPLHGIVKEFCGRCKDHNAKEKITKIQDMRNSDKMKQYGLDSIRRIVT